jgi:hypothetical protein
LKTAELELHPKIVMSKGREFSAKFLNHPLFNREAATLITIFFLWKLDELLKQRDWKLLEFSRQKIGSSMSRTVLVKIENLKIADLMDAGRVC